MTTHDPDQIKLLVEQLEAELPDHSWKALLEVLQIVGVADMLQIQEATGFDRERVRRILSKIEKVERGFGPIVKMLNQAIPRPGLRGRAPNVFRLEEWGPWRYGITVSPKQGPAS